MSLSMLPVTLMLAGALTLINLWLAFRVGQMRGREKVSFGDGGNDRVLRRMRAHANFVEYAPFFLALVGPLEFSVGTSVWLWAASALFLVGRVLHPFGMDGLAKGREVGTGLTFLLMLMLAIWAIALPIIARGYGGGVVVETVARTG